MSQMIGASVRGDKGLISVWVNQLTQILLLSVKAWPDVERYAEATGYLYSGTSL